MTDNFGHDDAASQKFIAALAERLAVDADCIVPAYEDVWHYLWRERRLPVNVDPLDSRLSDQAERERLARIFEQGLGTVVGHALPLDAGDRWRRDRSGAPASGFSAKSGCF